MFPIAWLNDNRIIGSLFAVLIVVNAYAIAGGLYR
jgi:hypothetical protein